MQKADGSSEGAVRVDGTLKLSYSRSRGRNVQTTTTFLLSSSLTEQNRIAAAVSFRSISPVCSSGVGLRGLAPYIPVLTLTHPAVCCRSVRGPVASLKGQQSLFVGIIGTTLFQQLRQPIRVRQRRPLSAPLMSPSRRRWRQLLIRELQHMTSICFLNQFGFIFLISSCGDKRNENVCSSSSTCSGYGSSLH